MSTIVIKPENKTEERLRFQEIAIFCYIVMHLSGGVYKQANQFTANAVLEGERKTTERTIQRLIDKGLVIVVSPGRKTGAKDAPAVLRPVSTSEFWRRHWRDRQAVQHPQKQVDTSTEMSTRGLSSGNVIENTGTYVQNDGAPCPAENKGLPLGHVHNRALLYSGIAENCITGHVEHCITERVGVSTERAQQVRCSKCNDALDSPYHKNVCRVEPAIEKDIAELEGELL